MKRGQSNCSAGGALLSGAWRRKVDCLGTLEPAGETRTPADGDILAAMENATWEDGGVSSVFDRVPRRGRVCVVVSDHTRRTAADRVLAVLAREAVRRGVSTAGWELLVSSGIHRRPSADELKTIVGEAAGLFGGGIHFHDADGVAGLVDVGAMPDGHTVRLNRRAVDAECLVLTGAAAYHYHAGFSGGRKSLVPGLAARETVAYNHSMTLDPGEDRIHPGVGPGLLEGNPVHESMLGAARLHPPSFIVNTVLSPSGELAGVYCGGMESAHVAACRHAARMERVDIGRGADLVVASAGTARDWIQSHKALFNAHRAMRPGGRIVLLAPCPEGVGNERFRHWVRKSGIQEIFRELRRQPEILGQTALSTKMRGTSAVLVTEMPEKDACDLGIRTAPDVDSAVDVAMTELRAEGCLKPTCYLMPHARHVVPFVTG